MRKVADGRDPERPWQDTDWLVTHRFVMKTRYDAATGCCLWIGAHDQDGYGEFKWRGRVRRAHAVVYEWFLGAPLPAGRQVHHAGCGRKNCVAIGHLLLVTPAEHTALHRRPTCTRGHLLVGDTVYEHGHRDGYRRRSCRLCHRQYYEDHRDHYRQWSRESRQRRRAVVEQAGSEPAWKEE